MKNAIRSILESSIEVKRLTLEANIDIIEKISLACIHCLKNGGTLFFFGNGGSAADAQHVAAEFIGRFQKERVALSAIALTTDTSILTCLSNDYSYDIVFSRQLEALGRKGDMAFGLTTSGKSPNVLKAFEVAKAKGISTVAFVGGDGGPAALAAEMSVIVPSKVTARIQESHITVFHAMCEVVENAFVK
ncbi:MAG: D-sedoheptulose 7-phosphate isomerase [Candidatus Omnitrophica bacterium]|nr:D-sedoheptulose 7-phosphate isomerase [Candidatus Omnitrophota bacterium]